MNAVTVLLCTAPEAEAASLANQLVSEKLAACVSVLAPMTSRYWWHGRIEEVREVMLIVKTAGRLAAKVRQRIVELHSYEVPEVLEFHADAGLPAYLEWVASSCGV